MVERTLVDLNSESIEAGERLVQGLEDRGVSVLAAFWMLGNSYADWRLALSTSTYEAGGQREAVEEVQRILSETGLSVSLDLSQVLLLSAHNAKVKAFSRSLFSDPKSSSARRIYGVSAGPELIDEAYIYKLAA